MWARIQDGAVAETTGVDPEGRYHSSLRWQAAPEGTVAGMTFDGADYHAAADAPAASGPRYVALPAIRMRLASAGLWTAFAHAMDGLPAEKRWRLLFLERGVAPDDADMLALLAAIGADPAEVLA